MVYHIESKCYRIWSKSNKISKSEKDWIGEKLDKELKSMVPSNDFAI
jgi:hypothetical protein